MDVFDPRVLPICREILLYKKQSLLNGLFEADDLPPPTESTEGRQLCFSLFEDQDQMLRARRQLLLYEIEHALAKIQNGVYGFCERTGRPIDRFRLLSRPWVRFALEAEGHAATESVFDLKGLEAP